jgi:hypothetical protein
MRLVADDFRGRYAQHLVKADLEIAVAGYVIYFKSKWMIP